MPGRANVIADWLSRTPTVDEEEINREIETIACPREITCFVVDDTVEDGEEESIKEGWWKSMELEPTAVPDIGMFKDECLKEKEKNEIPGGVTECSDGLYRYRDRNSDKITNVIYVPKSLRLHVMNWFHACMEGGHQGVNKTNKRMRKAVGWPKMFSDSKEFVKVCPCRRVFKLSNQLF